MTAGRRAPAHDISAAEFAAQQHTLNAALGNLGGKQKAWMTSAAVHSYGQDARSHVVKRRPQPTKKGVESAPPPRHQASSIPASPTSEWPPDKHPPSNSTSPQLANVLSHQSYRSPLPSPSVVLPSPAPSEETNNDQIPARALLNNPNSVTANLRGGSSDLGGAPTECGEIPLVSDAGTLDSLREGGSLLKRPMESSSVSTSKRRHMGSGQSHQGIMMSPTQKVQTPQQFDTAVINEGHRRELPQINSARYGDSARLIRTGTNGRSQSLSASATSLQPQHAFAHPRTLSRDILQQARGQATANGATYLLPQNATVVPSLASDYVPSTQCSEILRTFMTTQWNPSSKHQRDLGRLNVLKDAVEKSDFAYVTLHQAYCLLDVDPASIPGRIRTHPGLRNAIQIMREVLDSNEKLSPHVLNFFAAFPLPVDQIVARYPRRYNYEQERLLNFVSRSSNYNNLAFVCQQRHYPPLVRELQLDLGIESHVFQRIIFTAILRRIFSKAVPGCSCPPNLEDQANGLLQQNQIDYNHRRLSLPKSNDAQEVAVEHQRWGWPLRKLCERFIQESLGENFGPRGISTPHQGQAQVQPRQPSQGHSHDQAMTILPSNGSSIQRHIGSATNNYGTTPTVAQETPRRGPGRPRLYDATPARNMPIAGQSRGRPPGNFGLAHNALAPVRQPQLVHSQVRHLLPRSGVTQPQPVQPRPDRSALHLAHLRSPLLRSQSKDTQLFQCVKSFVKTPTRIAAAGDGIERWTVSISAEDLQSIPTAVPGLPGEPPTRMINIDSQLFRLRCVKWTATEPPDEHAWVVADTSWIPNTYFKFNGKPIHARKKLHHGKDLPIDISPLVTNGDNTLEIAVLRESRDKLYRNYLLAIEVVGVFSVDDIKDLCIKNYVAAADTILAIKKKLSGTDDDEISILQDNITINLFDPFSASTICDTPVRGKACLHHDCFDLGTFLQTRRKKGDASDPDHWKCPICSADARPQSLVIDGFLKDVRTQLAHNGLLKTRAIVVDQHGNWRPKVEVLEGVADSDEDDECFPRTPILKTVNQVPQEAIIIDLSD